MNTYSSAAIQQGMNRSYMKQSVKGHLDEDKKLILLPYCGMVSPQIDRIAGKFGLSLIYQHRAKLRNRL